jgi:hypothetical protein
MQITRTSIFSGIKRTLEIDISEEQYQNWSSGGDLLQNCAPHLSADDREFIMTGVTPEEWREAFGDDEDDSANTNCA